MDEQSGESEEEEVYIAEVYLLTAQIIDVLVSQMTTEVDYFLLLRRRRDTDEDFDDYPDTEVQNVAPGVWSI